MKKMFKIMAILTVFFTITVLNFSALQAELIEPTQSLKATAEDPGQLTVFSEPPGLNIKLDGKSVGQTPMRINMVDPGTHQLQVGESVTEIYVEPGQPFHISLFQKKFIKFQIAKKKEASGAGKTLASETPAPKPSSGDLRTKEENRKAWERWMLFVNGSSNHF